MVLPQPQTIDQHMSEAREGITIDQVVEFIRNAPPEFIDYIYELLAQEGSRSEPERDPSIEQALDSVTPVREPMVR